MLEWKYRTTDYFILWHSSYTVDSPVSRSFCFIQLNVSLFFWQKGAAPVTEGSDEEDEEDIDFDEDDFEGAFAPSPTLLSHSSNQQLIILNHSVVSINPYQMNIPLHCLDCRRWGRHAWALSGWEVRFVLSLFQKALVINQFICFIIWMDIKFWLVILVETRMTIFPFIQLFFIQLWWNESTDDLGSWHFLVLVREKASGGSQLMSAIFCFHVFSLYIYYLTKESYWIHNKSQIYHYFANPFWWRNALSPHQGSTFIQLKINQWELHF